MPNLHVVHEDGAGDRAAERKLVFDRRGRETFGSLRSQVSFWRSGDIHTTDLLK